MKNIEIRTLPKVRGANSKNISQYTAWILSILSLIIFNSCRGQSNFEKLYQISKTPSLSVINNADTLSGIVYFSKNNGLTWQNFSVGLPQNIQLGLGAIGVSENSIGLATKNAGIFLFDSLENTWNALPTDPEIIKNNIGSMYFFKENILIGTQKGGIFFTNNKGKNWSKLNLGLNNLTIRRFAEVDKKLLVGTNGGLFSFDEKENKWILEFEKDMLQVNGITASDENIYIATNQGAFTSPKNQKDWKHVFANKALHNISSDEKAIYAMVYNELLISIDKGKTWQSNQQGLPFDLYTFNVVKNGNSLFAGQWDGVYRKEKLNEKWAAFNYGLPEKYAITNMKVHNGIIFVSGNARKLKQGLSIEK